MIRRHADGTEEWMALFPGQARGDQRVADSSIAPATLSTSVLLPCPGLATFRVRTRCLLSSSATSRLTAEGSRERAAASVKIATVLPSISFNILTRAGVITSRKSAGSSNDTVSPGSSFSSRSSRRACTRRREKKRSIDSTPTRILPTGLVLAAFEVLADFRFEALFDAFI